MLLDGRILRTRPPRSVVYAHDYYSVINGPHVGALLSTVDAGGVEPPSAHHTTGLQPACFAYCRTSVCRVVVGSSLRSILSCGLSSERMTGIEPAVSCLASKRSTLEHHPRFLSLRALGQICTGDLLFTKQLHCCCATRASVGASPENRTLHKGFWRPRQAQLAQRVWIFSNSVFSSLSSVFRPPKCKKAGETFVCPAS